MAELQHRYLALDVFRGMTVCFMIIVNTPGSWDFVYAPLRHATWHGFTPADLIFPSFLFAVGNAMAFAMPKYVPLPQKVFWKKILSRTALIFLCGFLIFWFPFADIAPNGDFALRSPADVRILGVLQRIALCYLVASVVIHYATKKITLLFSVMALLLYWVLLYFLGNPADPYSLTGNAALKLDLLVLGERHLYHGEGIAFDPEGILSTLPAIVNVLAGFLAGDYIRTNKKSLESYARLFVVGGVLVAAAWLWSMTFPINKKLWTSSFVLLTCGLDLAILSLLTGLTQLHAVKRGAYFFEVFGRNPLFIYIFSELLIVSLNLIRINGNGLQALAFQTISGHLSPPELASLVFALLYMLLCWIIGYVLDRKRIYIKV